MKEPILGVERLLTEKIDILRGQRIGLVCNPGVCFAGQFCPCGRRF
ncbi:MAG: hypothetical protein IPK98_06310 [Chloracidobacterium sp.]|nr:hypothetical protein [Chloracidobacterium sp.]